MKRKFLILGAASAFIAVAAGAFGAHGLKDHLDPDLLQIFETAVRYQMYHAFAILIIALLINEKPSASLSRTGWLFVTGTVLFSGSLYIFSLSGIRWFGMITPFGGLAFLAGWVYLIVYAAGLKRK